MAVEIVLSLLLAIPIILLPFLFVWFVNAVGIRTIVKQIRIKRVPQSR